MTVDFDPASAISLDRAIHVTQSAGMIGTAMLLRAARDGRIALFICQPEFAHLFKDWAAETAGQPAVALIGDDDGRERGAPAWRGYAFRMARWASFVLLHASGAEPEHYEAAMANEDLIDLPGLNQAARTISASSKDKLPLIKLATFGDLRTNNNSLRSDKNVTAITGIEADYDGEIISFERAVDFATQAAILCAIYASPSHEESAPRWRVMCPFSKEYPPERRDAFMGRLNGLFGGIFSVESWTLSQAYYIGNVIGKPARRAVNIEGTPIDLLEALDDSWIGRPGAKTGTEAEQGKARPVSTAYTPVSDARFEGWRAKILANVSAAPEKQKHHTLRAAARALGGQQAARGFSDEEAVGWLLSALPDTVEDWIQARSTAMWGLAKGREQPFELEDRQQARSVPRAPRKSKANGAAQPQPAEEPPQEQPDQEPSPEIDDPGYHAAVDEAATSSLDPVAALVREFNGRYWVVNESGKILLYAPMHDPILNRRYHHRMDFEDLKKAYMNRMVKVGNKFLPAATVWLHHRDRRQYIRGVTFDPSGNRCDPEVLNLWQGFSLDPRAGDWGLMKGHIFEVICASSHELNDYLMDWMARLIQFPAQQGEVAVVLKGIEGTGKGILARALTHILGQHGLAINHAKHLTGNFNAHLRDCVFLFADEAFYAGDKAHVGVLKAMITEPTLTIEAKYANAVQTPNFIHLMMASNEDWVVPASIAARRFLVLLTTAAKVGNRAYFAAIQKQMEAGGYEAMLHELQHRDLTEFNVRDVPDTEGLQEQKKLSLGTAEAWWLDVLQRGYVYKSKLGLEKHFGEWHETVTTEVLFASYSEFAKSRNERHPMAREAFGQFMSSMGATAKRHRNGITGEHLIDVPAGPWGETTRKTALVTKERATGYSIGTLQQARDAFLDATKLTVEWEADAATISNDEWA